MPIMRRSKVSRKKTFGHRPDEYDILLVTDRMDLPAETIALPYRYRWTIEMFFRWFKCVLKFSHLMFESKRGVEILVHCALIASLLITLRTGRKPTKRTLETVQLYFQGWDSTNSKRMSPGSNETTRRPSGILFLVRRSGESVSACGGPGRVSAGHCRLLVAEIQLPYNSRAEQYWVRGAVEKVVCRAPGSQ